MNFVPVQVYINYIDAHIAKGQLEEEGIECWLKDEHLVSTTPFLTQAVGGIKLMVAEDDRDRTISILRQIDADKRANLACPRCQSTDVEFVTTPRKASNWLGTIFGGLFGDLSLAGDKVYHCFSCGHEFPIPDDPQ
ncbi:MAG: hypothetical protein JWP27_2203 [Flaviaesturariibacter sp.]|nr:hypothetical protein [Flaviaesturariibacter sp.]